MKVSAGLLPLPQSITVAKENGFHFIFSWSTEEVNDDNEYDQAMLLAYDKEHGLCMQKLTGQFRNAGSDTLHMEEAFNGSAWLLYVAFVSADRSSRSDSVYLGEMVVG